MIAPAFWVNYRGENDPQRPLATTYVYTANCYYSTGANYSIPFSIVGPPQLTKKDYMEIKWSIPPGMIKIILQKAIPPASAVIFWISNGAAQGFRDEGQFSTIGGEVTNQ